MKPVDVRTIPFAVLLALFPLYGQTPPPAGQATHADARPEKIPDISQASSQAPLPPLTPEKRADVYMARKWYREAIEVYRQAPKSSVILNKIGIAYHQLTDLRSARKHYEQALKLDAKYAEARNNLGTVKYAQRRYRQAIKDYKKALEVNPNSASIHSNLGTAYFARRKYKDAFEAYTKALSLDPEVFEHRSNVGVLLQERAVEEKAKFHYYLAKTYAQAGMTERALSYIRMSLEEGFKDRKKYLEEPEFANLQEMPEFQAVMALEPRVL